MTRFKITGAVGGARAPAAPVPAVPAVLVVLTVLVVLLAGCGVTVPTDPEGTLDRVRGGTLRVGVSPSEPWTDVRDDGTFGGVEVELAEAFARHLDADVVLTAGGEEELVGELERGDLDLVVGGLTDRTPWASKVAVTAVYVEVAGERGATERHVMAAPMGENAFLVELERFLRAQRVEVP